MTDTEQYSWASRQACKAKCTQNKFNSKSNVSLNKVENSVQQIHQQIQSVIYIRLRGARPFLFCLNAFNGEVCQSEIEVRAAGIETCKYSSSSTCPFMLVSISRRISCNCSPVTSSPAACGITRMLRPVRTHRPLRGVCARPWAPFSIFNVIYNF